MRITLGTDTGRLAVAGATIAGVVGEAQGDGRFTKPIISAINTEFNVNADQEVVADILNAATAGDGYIFIEYQERPFVTDTASQSPGIGALVDASPDDPTDA